MAQVRSLANTASFVLNFAKKCWVVGVRLAFLIFRKLLLELLVLTCEIMLLVCVHFCFFEMISCGKVVIIFAKTVAAV